MTKNRRRIDALYVTRRTPETAFSPSDREYWVAFRTSPIATLSLQGPLTLFEAYDVSDKLKQQFGVSGEVSTAYRAESRDDAAKNAAFFLTVV